MDEKTLIYFPEDNYYKFFWPFFSPSALFHFSLRDNYILFIWIPVYYVGVFLQIYGESFISIFILTSLFRNN